MNRAHDIEGEFHLFESNRSKFKNLLSSGCRPVHKIHNNYLSSGQYQFLEVSKIAPGETAKVAVWLVTPEAYPNSLWCGREIEVFAGPSQLIGTLKITSVHNSVLLGTPESYSPVWVEPQHVGTTCRS